MKDKYKIDSHKLIYHVKRVNKWLDGDNIFPIYMEVSPTGACNHRCVFCALDFMKYKSTCLDAHIFKKRLTEMGKLGVKSIMYAGEGEPFIHKDICDIALATTKANIDVSFTTNGVLLSNSISEKILPITKWVKVSCNAGIADTYAKIHRTKKEDFNTVIKNLKNFVELRSKHKYQCTIGMQIILLPQVEKEIEILAKIASDIGIDYLVVKPYSQHPQSISDTYNQVSYKKYDYLQEALLKYNTETFSAIFRTETMNSWDLAQKNYCRCLALPFWSYIDASGKVWGCSMYLNDDRFYYGNINTETFEEIWHGKKRKESLGFVSKELDVSQCRINCRMEHINKYLWELKEEPPKHVNFI